MGNFQRRCNMNQVKALLRKDVLVRIRQPWMVIVQILWPCIIFVALYTVRNKYQPHVIDNCQFPTRMLPGKGNLLEFFHSHICTIQNSCKSINPYEEYTTFNEAPLKPVLNIVQTFLNEDSLYNAVTDLPAKMNFVSAVTTLATHPKFKFIENNINDVARRLPQVQKMLGASFDIKKMFSDGQSFSNSGKVICGKPFPRNDNIRFVQNILHTEDFSEINDDELSAMPTNYCKQLYLDITSTNNGKITWSQIKPIIQGKIIYGPDNEDTKSIIKYTNNTFHDMDKLWTFFNSLNTVLVKIRTEEKSRSDFLKLLELAKSPFIRMAVGNAVNIEQIELFMRSLLEDETITDVIRTVRNILDCFSVDRFVAVNNESELEDKAYELGKKKLFYAGIYFTNSTSKNVVYKIRMDTDNTPVTIENRNRFWFPGPEASIALDLRYHRGFVQIKHAVDIGIIKHKKSEVTPKVVDSSLLHDNKKKNGGAADEDDWGSFEWDDDDKEKSANKSSALFKIGSNEDNESDEWEDDSNEKSSISTEAKEKSNSTDSSSLNDSFQSLLGSLFNSDMKSQTTTTEKTDVISNLPVGQFSSSTISANSIASKLDDLSAETITPDYHNLPVTVSENATKTNEEEDDQDFVDINYDELEGYAAKLENDGVLNNEPSGKRLKRQLGGLLSALFGSSKKLNEEKYKIDDIRIYTKQFPYPKYTKDEFKRGLYLSQAVQMAFFMALIVQIATCIRYRIWMRESKNTMLMRSMGLQPCAELASWIITTFIEIVIVFLIASIILYSGGILRYTSIVTIFIFLVLFGLCTISFCYMCSTIFSSASIGSVSSSIFFLMTFMPYIVIICLDANLGAFLKFITNLSFTTAFCYAWDHIMRLELQTKGLTLEEIFSHGFNAEFTYAAGMIILDMILYAVIGVIIEYFKNDEFKFHSVLRENLEGGIGASLSNVSKVYNETSPAVSDVSISFPKNEITCLLGRNGAGKSTIIKMLTGQIIPTSGKVTLSQSLAGKRELDKIGLCSQDNILIPQLTAREHLEMYAKIKLKNDFDIEVSKTMKSLSFGKYENYEAFKLSGGYQRRLCVAIAFIGSPNAVILDEPCSGVDTKARRCIWELIEMLRRGRAVILATHYLDEAEYLSDTVFILNNGKVIAQHNPETLKTLFTKSFDVNVCLRGGEDSNNILNDIRTYCESHLERCTLSEKNREELKITIPYDYEDNKLPEFIEFVENLQKERKIIDLTITSKSLEEIFNNLNQDREIVNGNCCDRNEKLDLFNRDNLRKESLSTFEMIKSLFWKRFVHFRRNYRLLLCVLILPALFEIIAMSFMQLRPGGEHEKVIGLTRDLYSGTTEILGIENPTEYTNQTYFNILNNCTDCSKFENSARAFKWILDSHDYYLMKRYGGITFNDSLALVWYNNKGFHSMMAWLNDLNSYLLKTELNDHSYSILTQNHPIKLGEKELSTSSILQQVADAGVSLILLLAFSLVIAGSSVFIVNERINGEKLQQKLCGVNFRTYWGVAFFWDFFIFLTALALCVVVLKIYNFPVYVAKSNLDGICLIIVLYGFATIPIVHVVEKLFAEASFANMAIFCINVVIALTTLTIIMLFDVLGDSLEAEKWRHFLNRAFLIFPQHALSDALIEICKNHIIAEVFSRYGIDAYKSPVKSNLLRPHIIALTVLGVSFMVINYVIESGLIYKMMKRLQQKDNQNYELKIVSIQNTIQKDSDKKYSFSESYAVNVDNICKSYRKKDYAVKDVSFQIRTGECFGLLGKNGAGKSTIFKMLSGQIYPTSGDIDYFNKDISYCPQTSALDSLLTVEEIIKFYGNLRRIKDISQLCVSTLNAFHLEQYKGTLVKNLSGGNRRKLNVAVSCFGDTNVVLMDEPTSDMDPVTRSLVYKVIKEILCEKRSILLTSHTISEIDKVCHRIAVIKDGKIISVGSPEKLKEEFGGYYIVTIFVNNNSKIAEIQKAITDAFPRAHDMQTHSHSIKFVVKVRFDSQDIKRRESATENNINRRIGENCNDFISLTELFTTLKNLSLEKSIQYTINSCRLDMIFEKILDSSDEPYENGHGVDSRGYVHKGFDYDTETIT